MTFKFAPDAVVIVERGDEATSIPGASLELDNTIFTADHRCRETNEDCEGFFWEGIRVQGYDQYSQSATGAYLQAYLKVTNNSMIEYAKKGAMAGHTEMEDPANNIYYGGGIIVAENSIFKDNIYGMFLALIKM